MWGEVGVVVSWALPSGAQETRSNARDQTQFSCMQGKHLTWFIPCDISKLWWGWKDNPVPSQFIYPLVCCWALEWFSDLHFFDNTVMNIGVHTSFWNTVFLFGDQCQSEIIRSKGSSMFNLLRLLTILNHPTVPPTVNKISNFCHILPALFLGFFDIGHRL